MKKIEQFQGGRARAVALSVLVAAGLAIFAISCSPAIGSSPIAADSSRADQAMGGISLVLDSASRTVQPADATAYTVTAWQVTGTGPSGAAFDSGILSSASYNRSLAIGTWTIVAMGLNSNGHVISRKGLDLAVTEGVTATATLLLARESGDGTIDLRVAWGLSNEFDAVTATLNPVGAGDQAVAFTVGENSATYDASLAAGDYLLNLSLLKTSVVVGTITEVIQVYEGYTTQASYQRGTSVSQWAYASANPVYEVDFDGSSGLRVNVTGAAGKSLYLVKANSSTLSVSASSTGSAASVMDVIPYGESLKASEPVYEGKAASVTRMDFTPATEFNANPPIIAQDSRSASTLPGLEMSATTVNYGAPATGYTVDSTTKTFWVQDASDAWVQITATLRAVGQYCYVWVDNARFSAGSAVSNDNLVTSAQVAALRDKFDGTSANTYNDGVFKNVTNIFGYEYGGGTSADSGGRDGDQHISVLVYDIGYDFVSTQTGGVLGYFWGKDYYDQTTLTNGGSTLKTNYMEMFYVDCHFADKYPNMIISTLAHEFQHMINFNQKYLVQGASSPTWYNEMCSMVAEDLVLANLGLNPVTDGAISRMYEYGYHYAESGITDWLTGNDALKSYASAFAFGAFLERNYGGATFFKNLSSNASAGTASVTAALTTGGFSDTFDTAFAKYAQTLVFTDMPAGSSVATLKKSSIQTIGSISYTAVPIDYATIQQYDLANGWVSGAYGPRVYAPDTAVLLRPYGNSVHTQSSWQSITGDLAVNLTAPAAGVKFYLMLK